MIAAGAEWGGPCYLSIYCSRLNPLYHPQLPSETCVKLSILIMISTSDITTPIVEICASVLSRSKLGFQVPSQCRASLAHAQYAV